MVVDAAASSGEVKTLALSLLLCPDGLAYIEK